MLNYSLTSLCIIFVVIFLLIMIQQYELKAIFILGDDQYDATSVKRASEFIVTCKLLLESDSNLFWVAFQSNVLADVSDVSGDFQKAFNEAKEGLQTKGWVLPKLESNMRNQVNIANIKVEKGTSNAYKMQSTIDKLESASSVVGEVPSLFNITPMYWKQNKDQILSHCIEMIEKKSDKNIVILHDEDSLFKDLEKTLQNTIKNQTILSYPSPCQNKTKSVQNVLDFSQQNKHILVTKNKYFNGCEACNVILLCFGGRGMRNTMMRGVQNVICIQIGDYNANMKGMKEDKTFC
jgi:hypothetical protein